MFVPDVINGGCWCCDGGEMGCVEAVIWGLYGGREVVGFCWFLGDFGWEIVVCGAVFLLVFCFDYLYLFYGLYWWVSVV